MRIPCPFGQAGTGIDVSVDKYEYIFEVRKMKLNFIRVTLRAFE